MEYLRKSSGGHWENLVWRSGLCDWCRGCMQMRGAVSMLVRGTVKSLKWRLVFTKDQYSAHCSSSLWLKHYHESSALGSRGRTSMRIFPCAVCRIGVGSNSIFCNGCKYWVHKKGSGLKCLKKDSDYRYTQCQETAGPLDGRPQKEVQVGTDKLKVVASFCYLGDMLSAAGGCELSATTHVKTAWKKFKDLLPVLSSCHLSFKTRGIAGSGSSRLSTLMIDVSGVRSAMDAASQLSGRGPTDVDVAPVPAH